MIFVVPINCFFSVYSVLVDKNAKKYLKKIQSIIRVFMFRYNFQPDVTLFVFNGLLPQADCVKRALWLR